MGGIGRGVRACVGKAVGRAGGGLWELPVPRSGGRSGKGRRCSAERREREAGAVGEWYRWRCLQARGEWGRVSGTPPEMSYRTRADGGAACAGGGMAMAGELGVVMIRAGGEVRKKGAVRNVPVFRYGRRAAERPAP